MEFFDSHSHYNDEKFDEDREEIIEQTYNDGITKFVCAGYNIPSSKFSLELVEKFIQSNSDFIVKYIRNNNQLIWEDLKVQLIKNKKPKIPLFKDNKNLLFLTNIQIHISFKTHPSPPSFQRAPRLLPQNAPPLANEKPSHAPSPDNQTPSTGKRLFPRRKGKSHDP